MLSSLSAPLSASCFDSIMSLRRQERFASMMVLCGRRVPSDSAFGHPGIERAAQSRQRNFTFRFPLSGRRDDRDRQF